MPTPRYRPQRPIKPPPQRAADCPKSLADNKPHHPKPQWEHDGADWPHRQHSSFVDAAGLRFEAVHGGFDGEAYSPDTRRMILVAGKA